MSRVVGVVTHTGREQAVQAAAEVIGYLHEAGLEVVVPHDEAPDLPAVVAGWVGVADTAALHTSEVLVVLGGDGTLLRAAELVRGTDVPVLGVNLGHMGFLAEAERDNVAEVATRVADRSYAVEERMTLQVDIQHPELGASQGWAINEVSIEKGNRQRMVQVAAGIDGQPVSRFAGDGMVVATPTGSTAYAFSAGGPVVWPGVPALVVVPICAHELFSRALVVSPDAVVDLEVLPYTSAVVWCDGRRSVDLPVGSRVTVRKSDIPVRLARLAPASFTKRLVAKFALPVNGLRG